MGCNLVNVFFSNFTFEKGWDQNLKIQIIIKNKKVTSSLWLSLHYFIAC